MKISKPSFLNKSLLLISLSHAVTDLSSGALPMLLPLFKSAFALSYTQVGTIVLVQNFTSSIIQPLFGFITDRLKLRWLTPASLMLAGIGTAATGLTNSYQSLLIIVIITGLGVAVFHPQAAKEVHGASLVEARGQSMAVFSLGGNLGQACGSIFMMALLTLPGGMSNTLYFCLPAVILAILLGINLKQIPSETAIRLSSPIQSPPKTIARQPFPFRKTGILLAYIFLRTSISTGLITYIPLYFANSIENGHSYASYLISAYLLSGVAGTYAGGVLGDKFGRKTIILGSMFLTFPLLSLFQIATGLGMLVLIIATGFIYISSFSSTTVLAQEMMPGHEALAASLTIGFSIGLSGVAVTLLGYIADSYGVPSVFTVIAFIPLIAFALAFFLPGQIFKPDHLATIPHSSKTS